MIESIMNELEANYKIFKRLLKSSLKTQINWKLKPKDWNMLEVVYHIRDEEREDFRLRIELLLKEASAPLSDSDPESWVEDRAYALQDFKKVRKEFLKERRSSIKWLRSLHKANWDNAYIHPKYGAMSARMFLVNCLAHDYLRIRQMIKLKYSYLKTHTKKSMKYAGDWE